MAIAMRQGMYRAIRPFRRGTSSDSELREAAEKLVIYIPNKTDQAKDKPVEITFKPRKTLAALEEAWDSLGIDEEDLLFGDERGISQSLSNLLQAEEEAPAERLTPFYSRED